MKKKTQPCRLSQEDIYEYQLSSISVTLRNVCAVTLAPGGNYARTSENKHSPNQCIFLFILSKKKSTNK